jgi:hypothetical protein
MLKGSVTLLLALALGLGSISCQKVDSERPAAPGPLPTQSLVPDSIPVEYGDLMAVTPHPGTSRFAYLWFEKPDKTITVVAVDFQDQRIQGSALQIPRR